MLFVVSAQQGIHRARNIKRSIKKPSQKNSYYKLTKASRAIYSILQVNVDNWISFIERSWSCRVNARWMSGLVRGAPVKVPTGECRPEQRSRRVNPGRGKGSGTRWVSSDPGKGAARLTELASFRTYSYARQSGFWKFKWCCKSNLQTHISAYHTY